MRGFGDYDRDGTASALKARDYKDATDLVAYGFQSTANACDAAAAGENISPTLRRDPMAVAIHPHCIGRKPEAGPQGKDYIDDGSAYCHDARGVSQAVASGLSVRRLTPTECERLQGFPDNFTQIPYRNKSAENCPDGPRYKALGNSMAVPVMKWIGERIQQVEGIQ
jgi:DNA (cytosine-5)-methyltransferase 1